MRRATFGLLLGSIGLCLTSCGAADSADVPGDIEPTPVAEATTDSDVLDETVTEASNDKALDPGKAEVPASSPAGGLTAYIGKFPFEAVGGVTWHDHPMVTTGIRNTVTEAGVLNAMRAPGSPSAPIATYEGKIGSWGCEQHNCGDHQWAVLVDPNTGATDVCYHNAEQTGDASQWFLSDGSQETRPGNCSVV